MNLAEATHAMFSAHVNTTFRVLPEGSSCVEMRLVSADAFGLQPGQQRAPFSLVFLAPQSCMLPQRIYPMDHAVLKQFELFLVPLGPDPQGQGMRYEAVFN